MTSPGPRPGDILIFYNARGLSRFITLLCRSPFYHVALSAGGDEVVEARPNGVARRHLSTPPVRSDYAVVPAPNDAGGAALRWAMSKIGDGYDPLDLAVIALDRVFAHVRINYVVGDRFTCGEFVATAFEKAAAPLFTDIDPTDVEPADFARFLQPDVRRAIERKARMMMAWRR